MNQHDKWSGGIGMVIGLAFCIASVRLGVGELHQPGPGFLPFLVGAVLLFLSSTISLQALRRKSAAHGGTLSRGRGRYRKGGLILLALVLYNFVVSFLGFFVTTFLFVVFLMKVVETQWWTRTIVTALCSAVGFHFVFQFWLMLDLPRGPWGF